MTSVDPVKQYGDYLILICVIDYLYIKTGELSLLHVPSIFATVNTHPNVFFVFLPGGISKEWRQIVSANCDFEGEGNLADVYGPFGEHLGDRQNSSRKS